MLPASNRAPRFDPPTPQTLLDSGLSQSLVLDLVLRIAFLEGVVGLQMLSSRTKLSVLILQALLREMQREQLCEAKAIGDEDYEFTLSARGRALADVALRKTHYAGPAPVALTQYNTAVRLQRIEVQVTADTLRSKFEDLVLAERVIQELGTALMTGGAILLYGPTGNGKTSIAERIHRIFGDCAFIPYAVLVAGQILNVFDPLVHEAVPEQPSTADPRWVLCRRPMVKVGGEMRVEMLEPQIDDATRICIAPLQMKANNGILLIDDFGRQRISPRELLNRWIVPLDRRTDVLSLSSGLSFEIAFEMLVIFSTNLALSDLAEDAFLRRLRNKIRIDHLSAELFDQLWRRICTQKGLQSTPEIEQHVRQQCLRYVPQGLRPCFAEDITRIIGAKANFEQRSPTLENEEIDSALEIYFGS